MNEIAGAVCAVTAAFIPVAGFAAECGDEVGDVVAGVVAEFAFEPPESADGHSGDEGDHDQAGQRMEPGCLAASTTAVIRRPRNAKDNTASAQTS